LSSPAAQKTLLRFLTAGSVDDGKSTLIGRLLCECDGVYEDQMEAVRKASVHKNGQVDLSLITDGLKAEREQAITIDVAYRYFSTPRRKFIIADTPGHEQYTRNMVTGASNADLAVLLVNARKGILEQTRRHACLLWLLGIRHLLLAVNKMDLVGYEESVFAGIRNAFNDSTAFMHGVKKYFVPLSALAGDNVVRQSAKMLWYTGCSLLEVLETVDVDEQNHTQAFRFPVQGVVRSGPDFRGYTGQIVCGTIRPGQEVMALPSGRRTRVEKIILYKDTLSEAMSPQSVVLTLDDQIDLGRGDMLVAPQRTPIVSGRFRATLIWMSTTPLQTNVPYLIRHATQLLCCSVSGIFERLDIRTFGNVETSSLQLNEIGTVELVTHKTMFFDSYSSNRTMGSFIMIDPSTNDTVAAGILSEHSNAVQDQSHSSAAAQVCIQHSSAGLTVWFTGLSGAGKTTICNAVYTELLAQGFKAEILDGDVIRKRLNNDLGFSQKDRDENVRRIGFVAQLLASHGVIVLVAAISPYRSVRQEVRENSPNFIEVYVNAPLEICEQRDPKGLYKLARNKQISSFTGVDDPYQPPLTAEVECKTHQETIKASSAKVVSSILSFFAARAATAGAEQVRSRAIGHPQLRQGAGAQSSQEEVL